MAIQVRRGYEADFDASKMLPGEWAVSLDTKYVRMCFAPGVVLRMATYEAFETDKAQIQAILAECKTIQSAMQRIQSEVNSKAALTIEYSNSAKESADRAYNEAERAKTYANNAAAVTGVQIATQERAGLIKGGDNYVAEDGTLQLITETTDTTMPNSYSGRLLVNEIGGVCEQETTTGKNLLNIADASGSINGINYSFKDGVITLKGTATDTTAINIGTIPFDGLGSYFSHMVGSGTNASVQINFGAFSTISTGGVVVKEFTKGQNIRLYITSGQSFDCKAYMSIFAGEVENVTWEPYTGGSPAPNPDYPQEIKKSVVSGVKTHGKNFCPINGHGGTIKMWLNITLKARNYISLGSTFVSGSGLFSLDVFGIKNGVKTALWNSSNNKTATIKNLSTQGYDKVNIQSYSNSADNVLKDTFVYLHDEVLTVNPVYEPYTESSITLSNPIDLYGIGDVQDVIEDGKTKRRFESIVFDGSDDEGWEQNQNNWFFTPLISSKIKHVEHNAFPNMLATHFTPTSREDLQKKINQICVSTNGNLNIYIDCSDLGSLKSLLTSKPMTVIYELAEETTEDLPLADQIALNSLETYDGITYLEFDSEVQPTFEGEYGTSKVGGYTLEGMLAGRNGELYGKSYNERLSALEASVVNNI